MRTRAALLGIALASAVIITVAPGHAAAGATVAAAAAPAPTASPSPKPTKSPSPFSLGVESYTSGTNQQFVGPGTNGASQIPNFAAGGPLAPGTPYDFFSGSPTVTGQALAFDLILIPTYRLYDTYDVSLQLGYGTVGGTGNVAGYWGDSLMPTLNPHLGQRAISLNPAFPTHNGQDPVNNSRFSVLNGQIAMHDGSGAVQGGWFNLKQTVPFVFSQAPWTNTPTQLVPQIPQSIGDGTPSVDVFRGEPEVLPLQGFDAWTTTKTGFTFEVSNGVLPGMPGTTAIESSFSGVYAQGQLKIEIEAAHLMQSGAVTERVLFGGSPTVGLNGYAIVPQSTVLGQRMSIEGAGATFSLFKLVDTDLRYGHSCYSADNVYTPSATCTGGNYYYAKFHQGFSKFDLAFEFIRFEPQYAPALLPYGTLENVWTAPYAFPGTWLNGSYQFVDNSEVGANRQGVRASTSFLLGPVETRLAFARYGQVSPYDLTTGVQSGFVEPYFSPQLTSTQGVRGTETHSTAWLDWNPKLANFQVELNDVVTQRYAPAGRPQDGIAVNYPSAVFSVSKPFGKYLAGGGVGRYALTGSYNAINVQNVDLTQNVVFFGLQFQPNAHTAYALQYQLFSVGGSPDVPNGLSPAYHGPQIQFYQRLRT